MNFKLFKNSWMSYYKRGFLTGLIVISIILFIDQILENPLFFQKIYNMQIFFIILSNVFFGAIFCGLISIVILLLLSLITKEK